MPYVVYILESESTGRRYIGYTADIENRLNRHNKGYERSTKSGTPWLLFWKSVELTRSEAVKLERKLKGMKSRKRVEEFIANSGETTPDE